MRPLRGRKVNWKKLFGPRFLLVTYRLFSCLKTRKRSDKSTYLRATPALAIFSNVLLVTLLLSGVVGASQDLEKNNPAE